jgi:hypothetical protein
MISVVLFILTQLVAVGLSTQDVSCNNLPTWSIKDFKVVFGAGQNQQLPTANASFTISGGLGTGSDSLTCTLRANSHCQIDGIPSDKNCHIYIQTYLDQYIVNINETVGCDGNPSYVKSGAR